jgi:hypothetical protein
MLICLHQHFTGLIDMNALNLLVDATANGLPENAVLADCESLTKQPPHPELTPTYWYASP